jgi:sulfite reductase alpha subunit-like flavoprotein
LPFFTVWLLKGIPSLKMTDATTLYILYGSATGNAEQIAKDLAAQPLPPVWQQVVCEPLEKYRKYADKWLQDTPGKHSIIIVTSTTGNGEAPENASRFVRYIKRKTTVDQQPFKECAFSVLALGDTNYDQFCNTGKVVDQKMQELGGTRVKPLAMADEATGLEDVVEPWTKSVLEEMAKVCFPSQDGGNALGDTTSVEPKLSLVATDASTPAPKEDVTPSNPAPAPQTTPTTTEPPATSSSTPLFILYGSATGNAEHIAKDIASTYEGILKNPDAKCWFPSVVCCELDQYKKQCSRHWEQTPPAGTKHGIIIVTSTTGNGDPPETASRFVRYIKRKTTVNAFQHCAFAVLGLGDTNYDQFCATGKLVDRKLLEQGGMRAKPLAMADEATGLEDVVEPWTQSVLMDITNACQGDKNVVVSNKAVSKTVSFRKVSDSDKAEEKKMESDVVPAVDNASPGVVTVRSLLSLQPSNPLPAVAHNTLPSIGTSLSSCELVHDHDHDRRRSRGMSLAEMDRMTVSSGSTATLLYTMAKPHETNILNASYLTNTPTDAAATVSNLLQRSDKLEDNVLIEAMDTYAKLFPLSAVDGSNVDDASVFERNGKRVIEMTMSLPDDFTLEYQPGDSLGIIVPNTPQAVEFVLSMLQERHNVKPSQRISIDSNHPVTVEEAVRTYIDLCSPIKNKRILHSLSQFATDPEEINVLRLLASKTPQGEEVFMKLIDEQRMSVVDVLREFPSSQNVSLEGLIGMLTGIPPRYYSVSSSPLDPRNRTPALTVAFSVVDYLTPSLLVDKKEFGKRRIGGVATRFLEVVCSPFLSGTFDSCSCTLKIFPKPAADFHLPTSLSTPLILIGPGTGVAPFVGFLRHRKAQAMQPHHAASSVVEGTWRGDFEMEDLAVSTHDAPSGVMAQRRLGKIQLFFGCRRADHDWLFREEMAQLKEEGVVSELYTAFSRQEPKQYIQDIMIHDEVCRASLVELILEDNASVYICGDGNQMAKDVQNAIVEVLSSQIKGAPEYLENMKTQRRLLMDIWTS